MRGAALARAGRASMSHDGWRQRKAQDRLSKHVPVITEGITQSSGHAISAQENVPMKANRMQRSGHSSSSSGGSGDFHPRDAKAQCADEAANAVVQGSNRTWMQSTVELLGSEGEVYALRPTGERRYTVQRENKVWKSADECVLDVGCSSQGSTNSSWDSSPSKANGPRLYPKRNASQDSRLQAASNAGLKPARRQRQDAPVSSISNRKRALPCHASNIKLLNQRQSSSAAVADREAPSLGDNTPGCGTELQGATVLHKDCSPDGASADAVKDPHRSVAAVPVHVLGSDIPDMAKDKTRLHIDPARPRLRGPSGGAVLSSQASTSSHGHPKISNRGLQVVASKSPLEPTTAQNTPPVAESSRVTPEVSINGVARTGQVPIVSAASRSSRPSSRQRAAGGTSSGFDRVMVLPATAATWADDTSADNISSSPELHNCDGELPEDIKRVLLEALHGSSQDFEAVCSTLREPMPMLSSQRARPRGHYNQQCSPLVEETGDKIVATLRPSAHGTLGVDACPATSHPTPEKLPDQISARLARLDPKWRGALLQLLEEAEKKDSEQDDLHREREKKPGDDLHRLRKRNSHLVPPSSNPAGQCYKQAKQRQRQS